MVVIVLLLVSNTGNSQPLPDCSTVPLGSPCQSNGQVPSGAGVPQISPSQAELYQKLTAEQKKAVDDVMRQRNGALTPEAVEALKTKPEFRGITPKDVLTGKEMMEKNTEKKLRQN